MALIARWEFLLPVAIITGLHIIIDIFKFRFRDTIKSFVVDQVLHIGVIVAVVALWHHFDLIDIPGVFSLPLLDTKVLLYILAFVLITKPSSVFIEKLSQFLKVRMGDVDRPSDENAAPRDRIGAWIGYLERILILIFILVGHYEAIGFLIAAKSILRFGEMRTGKDNKSNTMTPNPKKHSEYVLFGTLLSFTIAVVIGVLVQVTIKKLWL